MWLLIDDGEDKLMAPFEDRYLLFTDPVKLMKEAYNRGFSDWLGRLEPTTMSVGSMVHFACHPVNVKILRLEITT